MPDHAAPIRKTRADLALAPEFLSREFCVVGIGASAGGLEACQRLLAALPAVTGMDVM